jgi:TfoX/Sxy family transcriptional regulator of competence genes
MGSSLDFIEYICTQIAGTGIVTYRKMFGEYMVYINAKPILLVCDNTVYVKMLECLKVKMKNAEIGTPYNGAKPHYILDIDNDKFCKDIVKILETVVPVPIPKSRKIKNLREYEGK